MVADVKPLFIPLRAQYFADFVAGMKHYEYRPLGPRWNEKVCFRGRPVLLSRGYGLRERATGVITEFFVSRVDGVPAAYRECYPKARSMDPVACIGIGAVFKINPPA